MALFFCFLKIKKMAENKNVVEMLGEYLASLSGLIKKWHIWGLDLKKILHMLHQIRKYDLIGLSEGTHRIEKIHVPKYEKEKPKFKVLIDLGIFSLPDNYVDKNCMAIFRKKYHKEVSISGLFSDENMKESSGIKLKPGDRFHVLIYKFVSPCILISSDDIRSFLQQNSAFLLDAKGIAIVYDQKKDLIPKNGDYYYSFGKSCYLPSWLNFQGNKFVISYQSIDNDHEQGTVFFAFIPV